MRINVRSLFLFAKAVVPHMEKQGGGSIVNISSGGAAHETQPFMPPGYMIYVVAKAALERFSSALAPEVAPIGITVNASRPGAVKTEKTEEEFGTDHDWTGWREPASVVPAVVFLVAQIGTDFTGRGPRCRGLRGFLARVGCAPWVCVSTTPHNARSCRSSRRRSCACTCAASRRTTRRTSATPRRTSRTTF